MTAPEPVDLLLTVDELLTQRRRALDSGAWLDAYLSTAGLYQLVEDRLHPDDLQLRRAGDFLGGGLKVAIRSIARAVELPSLLMQGRTLRSARDSLSAATIELARVVLGDPADAVDLKQVRVPRLPEVLRIPSCFRSFDQHPDDIRLLVERYCAQYGTNGPVCVVGIRTSGCYLAPLAAAALRSRGVHAVSMLSLRPGRPLHRTERQLLRDVADAGGRVLLVDDPPVSGTALATSAQEIGATGVPAERIIMLLALAAAEPPPALRPWDGVFLPWADWTVHSRLDEVADSMAGLLGPGHRVSVEPLPWPSDQVQRGRVRARYAIRITDAGGAMRRREIAVEGAGLGYFGQHAVTVAARLPDHCPKVYGLIDGLLYRDWLPATGDRPDDERLATAVVRYVVDRGRALEVPSDPTAGLQGRQPAWEVVASLLSRMFGGLAPVAQILLIDRLARQFLHTTMSSVTDGQTQTRLWLDDGQLRKVGFDERSFGNLELACYDELFDLAGAAADPPSTAFESLLRATYEERTGRTVDPERWLLYRLAHLWRLRRAGDLDRQCAADRSSAAVNEYLASVLGATNLDGGGDLCAIDLDGVLETDVLGFPSTTPAGVQALRFLASHGFRPVPVTGRSLFEVIARCNIFGLVGATAEYGAVVYDHRSSCRVDLRDAGARTSMERIRDQLSGMSEVELDPRYEYIVRARHRSGPLPPDVVATAERVAGGPIRVVRGEGQTDFVPASVDKGTGVRALAQLLGSTPVFAVGDTAEDLAMFAGADLARAPRNADAVLRAAGLRVTRSAYQAGLAEACRDLIGHRPGDCDQCRPPRPNTRSGVLLALLGLREDGLRGVPSRTARLMVRRSRW